MSLRRLMAFTIVTLAGAVPGFSQAFSSGSNGSDGALNFTTPGTIDFDPVALGLNPAGDNIFNFTTINISAGVTVKLRSSKLREKSVVWLASGAVTIAGTLDLSGATGYPGGSTGSLRVPAEPGPGGYPGGIGADSSSPAQAGAGPGGSQIDINGSCASYATKGGCETAGAVYGNSLLVPLRGGSGGAGCPCASGGPGAGGGGGAGGGAIQIVSTVSISVTGSVLANGGGQTGTGGYFGANAGSGSGGAIHLEAPLISGNGVVQALGAPAAVGSAGSGWIRADTTTNSFTGTFSPGAVLGPLFNVPLPSAVPTVSITSINSVAVPAVPTGSFTAPDVTIASGAAVPVAIAAANIPVGTVVNLIISSETGSDQVAPTTPLAGTTASSTATASITWPLGVSSVYIRATW